MNAIALALSVCAGRLTALDRSWALIGGLAVSCHADPRFTRDIDIAIAVADDGDAEALVHAFVQAGSIVASALEQDAVHRLATVRLVPQPDEGDAVPLDLMFASTGIEPEICDQATVMEALPDLAVPVASRAHLIAMKVLSVDDTRMQDAIDLRALLGGATPADLDTARSALELITARGFHRGRDLMAILRKHSGST
jgi:predicted nucleotidyltransferase